MEEVWKDVVDYEGLYQVSSLGRVKGCERIVKHPRGGNRILKEKFRSLANDTDGYKVVDLPMFGRRIST